MDEKLDFIGLKGRIGQDRREMTMLWKCNLRKSSESIKFFENIADSV